jgi:hypothetical protein
VEQAGTGLGRWAFHPSAEPPLTGRLERRATRMTVIFIDWTAKAFHPVTIAR